MTTRAAIINDIHLNDRGFSSMREGYNDDMFNLMYQCHEVAKQERVDVMIQAGDLFDVKSPAKTSHATVAKVIDWAKAAPVPLYGIAGNHDLKWQRLDSLWHGQPLGTVFRSGALRYKEGWLVEDGFPIYLVHYQQNWYSSWQEQSIDEVFKDFRLQYWQEDPHALVVTHVATFPPGQEPMYEHVEAAWLADKMGNKGALCYGDIHNSHGVYDVNGVRFCNFGALSRGSLTEDNLNRPVGVTIWDSKDNSFEFVPLDYKPAEEIFLIEEVATKKENKAILEGFLSRIEGARVEVTSTQNVLDLMRNRGYTTELVDLAEELLEE